MKALRVLGHRALGTRGFAVCTGAVGRPARRCLWRIVAMRMDRKRADRAMAQLPAGEGRAVLLLDTRALVIVNPSGAVVQDNRLA